MRVLRSERWSAVLLILAAALGLVLANTPLGPGIIAFTHGKLGFLSLADWVTEGLLAVFFFLVAIVIALSVGKLVEITTGATVAIAVTLASLTTSLIATVVTTIRSRKYS